VLSLLLLGFIVYGTTVEAAHTHGRLTANSAAGASNFSGPATDVKETTTLLGCGECLICQLHQNFSATLISVPPSIGQSSFGSRSVNSTTVTVHSQTTTPRTGRAPPISL
jgi:subtilisin family serine protease